MPSWDNVALPLPPRPNSYAAPLVDFSAIGNLGNDYFQGQQQNRQLQALNAFPNGLPRDPNTGQIDQNAMLQTYAKIKGADAVPGLLPLLLRQQALSQNEQPDMPAAPFMPQRSRQAENTPQSGEDTMSGGPPVVQATEGMISAVPDTGPNAGRNIAPEVNAAGIRAMPGAALVPPNMLAAGVTPQAYADYALKEARRYNLSGYPEAGKTWQARGQAVLDAIKQAAEIPTEAKLAAREGMSVPEYQSVVKGQEAVGGAVGKRVGEVVEAGGLPARHTINTLDIMEDALNRAGRNITTGPGAAEFLRLKQAAQAWLPGDWSKGLTRRWLHKRPRR